MGKLERKRERLQERITHLEQELATSLTRKADAKEINVGGCQIKIAELKKELLNLK